MGFQAKLINVVKSSVSLLITVWPLESSVLSNYHQHVIIVYEAPVYCLGGTSDHCPVAAVALCNNMHLKWHAWLDLSFFEIVEFIVGRGLANNKCDVLRFSWPWLSAKIDSIEIRHCIPTTFCCEKYQIFQDYAINFSSSDKVFLICTIGLD